MKPGHWNIGNPYLKNRVFMLKFVCDFPGVQRSIIGLCFIQTAVMLSTVLCEDTVTITLLHFTTTDFAATRMAWKDHTLAQTSYLSYSLQGHIKYYKICKVL